MIDVAGVLLSLVLLKMLSSMFSKSGTLHSTDSTSTGSSGLVRGVTGEVVVAFSSGGFAVHRLLFVKHFERHWVLSTSVRRHENSVVIHFDERL